MQNHLLRQAAAGRNDFAQPEAKFRRSPIPTDLAVEMPLAGRDIWRRTRRPPATCIMLADLAGYRWEGM